MDDKLRARYLAFLQRMEEIRGARGREALPFLLCGDLRDEHVSKGNVDDYLESYLKGIHNIRKELKSWKEGFDSESRRIDELEVLIGQNEGSVGALHDEMHSMDREIGERLDKMEQTFTDSIERLVESFKSRNSEMEKSIEELAAHEEQTEETEVSEADPPPAVGLDLSECWIVLGVA
jgi:chromosome segregation ATPase